MYVNVLFEFTSNRHAKKERRRPFGNTENISASEHAFAHHCRNHNDANVCMVVSVFLVSSGHECYLIPIQFNRKPESVETNQRTSFRSCRRHPARLTVLPYFRLRFVIQPQNYCPLAIPLDFLIVCNIYS